MLLAIQGVLQHHHRGQIEQRHRVTNTTFDCFPMSTKATIPNYQYLNEL